MRVVLFANNRLGARIAAWLRGRGDEIVALVVHPPERQHGREEIIEAAGAGGGVVLDGSRLRETATRAAIGATRPDIGVSVLFGYVLRADLLRLFPAGCVNLHPALLPYNRGAYPNVWSIIDGTPAGATLHYIDTGIDTGDIIAQLPVEVEPIDTGETLYRKLDAACLDLFFETWPAIAAGTAHRTPQPAGGTCHRVADVAQVDEIDLDRGYPARRLIDLIRARTFPPYSGAYFRDARGRRVGLRIELRYEEEK